jgi:hypothetical protein
MEETGGEPDVVGHDKKTGELVFFDYAAESPKGRRSLCYEREALVSRNEASLGAARRRWPLSWASNCSLKSSTSSHRTPASPAAA